MALIAAVGCLGDLSAAERWWVFFRDKGGAAGGALQDLTELRRTWPERSLARRLRAGATVDRADLDVLPEYLAQVQAAGADVQTVSRWLNAAGVSAEPAVLPRLRRLQCVRGLSPVQPMTRAETCPLPLPSDSKSEWPSSGSAYGASFLQSELSGVIDAHWRGLTGKGVLVGMLDTGFDLRHQAFDHLEVLAEYDFVFGDPDPSWDFWTDPPGQTYHGTACLSVLVGYDPGRLVGIAPGATVALAKTERTGSESRIEEDYWVEGLEWLEYLGCEVVSSSLIYRQWYNRSDLDGLTPAVSRAAQRASELGMVICNAAGNAGPGWISLGAPADAPGVLAVAAVDSQGRPAPFTSRGPTADGRVKPDLAALGVGVVCVRPGTHAGYNRWNGTSLACPIVAGVAALVLETHPDWPGWKVSEALRSTASQAHYPDYLVGYGLVNAAAALDYPSLAGRVVSSATGAGAPRVTVSLSVGDHVFSAITDRWGFFHIADLPEGTGLLTLPADSVTAAFQPVVIPGTDYITLSR